VAAIHGKPDRRLGLDLAYQVTKVLEQFEKLCNKPA